jgi:hypothetical protein
VIILGFVLDGDPHVQAKLIDSVLIRFTVIGSQLRENASSLEGSRIGLASESSACSTRLEAWPPVGASAVRRGRWSAGPRCSKRLPSAHGRGPSPSG